MTTAVVVIIVLALLVGGVTAAAARPQGERSLLRSSQLWVAGGLLALARIGALWFLLHSQWTQRQSVSLVVLVMLLYPEALVLPEPMTWTISRGVLFSLVLIAGSFLWGGVLVVLLGAAASLAQRYGRP